MNFQTLYLRNDLFSIQTSIPFKVSFLQKVDPRSHPTLYVNSSKLIQRFGHEYRNTWSYICIYNITLKLSLQVKKTFIPIIISNNEEKIVTNLFIKGVKGGERTLNKNKFHVKITKNFNYIGFTLSRNRFKRLRFQ